MNNSVLDLSQRLVKALDKNYNVIDMGAVLEVVSLLEQVSITKEILETTRLGKSVNELRRKTKNVLLAKRAKGLVKKWRDIALPDKNISSQTNGLKGSSVHNKSVGLTLPNHSKALTMVSPVISGPVMDNRSQSPFDAQCSIKKNDRTIALFSERSHSPLLTSKRKIVSPASDTVVLKRSRHNGLECSTTIELHNSNSSMHSTTACPEVLLERERRHKKHKKERKTKKHKLGSLEPDATSNSSSCHITEVSASIDPTKSADLNFSGKFVKCSQTSDLNVGKVYGIKQVISPGLTFSQNSNGGASNLIGQTEAQSIPAIIEKPLPKKRGRKKGSKIINHQVVNPDVYDMNNALATISSKKKMRTTKELIADLQKNLTFPGNSSKMETVQKSMKVISPVLKTISEKPPSAVVEPNLVSADPATSLKVNEKPALSAQLPYLSGNIDNRPAPPPNDTKTDELEDIDVVSVTDKHDEFLVPPPQHVPSKKETPEEILSRLSPLDLASIVWEDNQEIPCTCKEQVLEPDNSSVTTSFVLPKKSIFDVDYEEEPPKDAVVIPAAPLPQGPTYIVDPDCPAKLRYCDGPKNVTSFHLNVLHNKFVPNVNGNWDMGPRHTPSMGKDLFDNIVPNYSFLVQERVKKDFSTTKFSKLSDYCASPGPAESEICNGFKQLEDSEPGSDNETIFLRSSARVHAGVPRISEKAIEHDQTNSNLVHTNILFSDRNCESDNGCLPSFSEAVDEAETSKGPQFREWFQTHQQFTYNEDLLTILPYVVID